MGKRSTGRKLAMQILYQADIRQKDITEIISDFFQDTKYLKETKAWASDLAKNAWAKKDASNNIISKYAIGWDINRINIVDKSILRIALYELRFTQTPINIILDEAIEMAKKYSTEESPKFINGILGSFVEKECSQV